MYYVLRNLALNVTFVHFSFFQISSSLISLLVKLQQFQRDFYNMYEFLLLKCMGIHASANRLHICVPCIQTMTSGFFQIFSTMGKKIFLRINTFQDILRLFYPYNFFFQNFEKIPSPISKVLKTDI
jgi:hypothetical protein